MDKDVLLQAALTHLESQHSTLWSRSWYVQDRGSRVDAAIWLTGEVQAVLDIVKQIGIETNHHVPDND